MIIWYHLVTDPWPTWPIPTAWRAFLLSPAMVIAEAAVSPDLHGAIHHGFWMFLFFPTCQVRVARFCQSCCPPPPSPPPPPPPVSPRPCLHQLPPPLPPCQLFAKLFANFRAQCALLDLNLGPSQLSAHRWTSTWDLPSSVRTAGPQPGAFPAQCAPLDLNGQRNCQKICQIEC